MPPITTIEQELAGIRVELARMATAHEKIAIDFKRFVDTWIAQSAIEQQLFTIQLELTRRSLELMNQAQSVPRTALPEPETTAGGKVPGVKP